MFAYDVDEEQGERDDVFLNGHRLGSLAGVDSQWSVNTFWVPAYWVKFGPSGAAHAHNEVRVDIDVNNAGWAVEVAWGELQISPGPEPVVMAHGLNGSSDSNGDGFNDGWVTAKNRYEEWLPELDGRIAAPPMTDAGGSQEDVEILADAIDDLREDTGFSRVNLLGHSFGGLTSRRYAFDHLGRVDSLVMIATPNGGSEVATDLCRAQRATGWGRLNPRRWVDIGGNVLAGGGHCGDENGKLYQLQEWYVRDVFNEMVRDANSEYPDRTTTDYHTIGGTKAGFPSGILSGQDDGMVELHNVMWLRPEHADVFGLGDNPNHPGRHEPWSVHNLRHGDLIKQNGPLDDAVCLHYARHNAGACPEATGPIAAAPLSMAAMSAAAADAVTDVVAAPAEDVAPGATVTIDLATEGYDGAALAADEQRRAR